MVMPCAFQSLYLLHHRAVRSRNHRDAMSCCSDRQRLDKSASPSTISPPLRTHFRANSRRHGGRPRPDRGHHDQTETDKKGSNTQKNAFGQCVTGSKCRNFHDDGLNSACPRMPNQTLHVMRIVLCSTVGNHVVYAAHEDDLVHIAVKALLDGFRPRSKFNTRPS